jgi:predicted chitinase
MNVRSHIQAAWLGLKYSYEDIFTVFRDLKWLVVISVVISLMLYLPDQVRELYRISAADGGLTALKQLAAIFTIGLCIWFGAFQITTETLTKVDCSKPWTMWFIRTAPMFLGMLPMLAATAAQLLSRPALKGLDREDLTLLRQVGNIFRIQENTLYDHALILIILAAFTALIAIIFGISTWRLRKSLVPFSSSANRRYFGRPQFGLVTVCFIALVTALFVVAPDSLPQALGSFGVFALFTICVVLFSVQASLLAIKHGIPYIPLICVLGVVIAAIGSNDNHQIRIISDAPPAPPRISAKEAFRRWLTQPDRVTDVTKASIYPVFIVSAQGGGLYAAYNTATFLARLVDLCPGFRRHLFAISSVSGGSVGAAVFASALHLEDSTKSPILKQASATGSDDGYCPKISTFLSHSQELFTLDAPGPIEQDVQQVLANDFLAPLVAGLLFPDFTQLFIPRAIGLFDRARTLEYTLENAVDRLGNNADSHSNLLTDDYQLHWSADNGIPALIMNSTDAGSGKRVLISPFDIGANTKDSDLCTLANMIHDQDTKFSSLHFRLSTAAFISARFPWVTPAATVNVDNQCITDKGTVRLVDGGYIDNSGVETALNLIDSIQSTVDIAALLRKIKIYHISLSGGDFPDRGAFSFGDLMEPIRALLSSRTSRAYIALNRAGRRAARNDPSDIPSTFGRVDLQNYFYSLPLGWALSEKTRDIISLDSGRFWDCHPNDQLTQSDPHLSKADCEIMQVYHLLNHSVSTALSELGEKEATRHYLSPIIGSKHTVISSAEEAILACYERRWIQERAEDIYTKRAVQKRGLEVAPYRQHYLASFQSEYARALLSEWERQSDKDTNVLAYLLGSISYDSEDFSRTTENLSFKSETQVPASWKARISKFNELNKNKNSAAPDVHIADLLKDPTALANAIWGPPLDDYDNTHPNDGWIYRSRGIYQIVGRGQYQVNNAYLGIQFPLLKLDIVTYPDAVWDPIISAKVAIAHFFQHTYHGKTLVQLAKDSNDWEKIRSLQTDMDQINPRQVAERTNMFVECMREAANPPRLAMQYFYVGQRIVRGLGGVH